MNGARDETSNAKGPGHDYIIDKQAIDMSSNLEATI